MPGSSAKSKATTIRLPNRLLERVDRYAEEQGLSRSAAIAEMLELMLDEGPTGQESDVLEALEDVKAELREIKSSQVTLAAMAKASQDTMATKSQVKELADAQADDWKKKSLIDRLLKR